MKREDKPTRLQNVWRNPSTTTVFEMSLAENQNVVKSGSKSGFSFSKKNKTLQMFCRSNQRSPTIYRSTAGIRSVTSLLKTKKQKKPKNPTANKEDKTSRDLCQGRQLFLLIFVSKKQKIKYKNQKNGTTYGKPWGGTDAFLAPWKQKNCQKRSTRAWFIFFIQLQRWRGKAKKRP